MDQIPAMTMVEASDGTVLLRWSKWVEQFPWVSAGFSTRIGGVSKASWNGLNCGLHVGDKDADVVENRRRLSSAAGFSLEQWTGAEQVHGKEVAIAGAANMGAGHRTRTNEIPAKDAIVTDVPGLMLTALYADCVPIWLIDPVSRGVGIVHAGWRGSVNDIAGEAVRTMQQQYGSDPGQLHAAIGPSIRGCCYEVDEAVAKYIPRNSNSLESTSKSGYYKLDLAKFNYYILEKAGIMTNLIEICEMCTSCRTDLFFSHRKEKGRTGRMAAWIARME